LARRSSSRASCTASTGVAEPVVIPRRFSGPPESANGGYTCGLVAGLLGGSAAEVTLRSPPPLERPLAVERDGDAMRLIDDRVLVAEGRPAELELELPRPVSVDDAEAASSAGRERWTAEHPFPGCVVCGPDRVDGDGFRLFPGPLGNGLFAAVWTPESAAPEQTWAALDCPTSAPVANFGDGPSCVLGRLAARIDSPPEPGRPHVVLSWPLELDGRKRHAGAALFSADGAALAVSRALWIELRG
jgi:hypothetical protein